MRSVGVQIVHYPHPILRKKASPIRRVDAELRAMVREMFERMYAERGVGLAANQVNLPLRVFVLNPAGEPGEGEELVFINPVVTRPRGTSDHEEGCLSLPGVYADVTRPETIHVNAYDLDGNEYDQDVCGFLARIIQHEFDHLNGLMFFDRLSELARFTIDDAIHDSELAFRQRRLEGSIPGDDALQAEWDEWIARYGQTDGA
jgi:peptide deformylase